MSCRVEDVSVQKKYEYDIGVWSTIASRQGMGREGSKSSQKPNMTSES